jgi:hypothetical protein
MISAIFLDPVVIFNSLPFGFRRDRREAVFLFWSAVDPIVQSEARRDHCRRVLVLFQF